ncbi:MAG: hypothetical protein LBM71_05140 [Elusimicrobiota bacterium]|jgi:hypothetical protein|nr:hypothetical protein [Elusimicrobiota bacterium]
MQVLWRVILLAILHFGVLICFPNYTNFAPITVFIIFLLCSAGAIAISSLLSIFGVRGFLINRIVDMFILLGAALILLTFTPQSDGVTPFDKVMNGRYPTQHDIDKGLAKMGLGSVEEIKQEVSGKVDTLNQNAQAIIKNEPRD